MIDEKRPKMQAAPARRTTPRPPRKIDPRYLENAALYYLQRYATSSQNLKNVLLRKIKRGCTYHGQNPDDFTPFLDQLIVRYQASGLLDDTVYADGRVGALRRQGLSRQAIMQRLSRKGLSNAEITAAIARIDAATDEATEPREHELAAARILARRKRIGPWRRGPLADAKAAQKEMAVLARNGFSYDIAREALETPADMQPDQEGDF